MVSRLRSPARTTGTTGWTSRSIDRPLAAMAAAVESTRNGISSLTMAIRMKRRSSLRDSSAMAERLMSRAAPASRTNRAASYRRSLSIGSSPGSSEPRMRSASFSTSLESMTGACPSVCFGAACLEPIEPLGGRAGKGGPVSPDALSPARVYVAAPRPLKREPQACRAWIGRSVHPLRRQASECGPAGRRSRRQTPLRRRRCAR